MCFDLWFRRLSATSVRRLLAFLVGLSIASSARGDLVDAFTQPYRDIDVSAVEIGGLTELRVQEGDHVTAGQTVASLDTEVLNASLEMARVAVASEGRLNSALAELAMQTERLQKLQGLFERHHASQAEVDRTRAQVDIAKAQVQAVRDELQMKRMELHRIEAQIGQRQIHSPIDGVVTQILKDEGEYVSATDAAVVKVVQLDPLLVIFSVPMKQIHEYQVGQTVSVHLQHQKEVVEGRIEFISPTADAQSSTTRIKVVVPNPKHQWLSGQPCTLGGDKSTNSTTDNDTTTQMTSQTTHPSSARPHSAPNASTKQ